MLTPSMQALSSHTAGIFYYADLFLNTNQRPITRLICWQEKTVSQNTEKTSNLNNEV